MRVACLPLGVGEFTNTTISTDFNTFKWQSYQIALRIQSTTCLLVTTRPSQRSRQTSSLEKWLIIISSSKRFRHLLRTNNGFFCQTDCVSLFLFKHIKSHHCSNFLLLELPHTLTITRNNGNFYKLLRDHFDLHLSLERGRKKYKAANPKEKKINSVWWVVWKTLNVS